LGTFITEQGADIQITQMFKEVARLVGIELLDHVILNEGEVLFVFG